MIIIIVTIIISDKRLEFAGNNSLISVDTGASLIINLFKLLFTDDESVISSTISVDSANQNQTQSHDDLTNPHISQAIERSEDDVQIEDSKGVTKTRSKKENDILTQFMRINVSTVTLCRQIRPNSNAVHQVHEKC